MELSDVIAREAIRDLVARYNANGDSGRFAEVRKLFADDAVMVLEDGTYSGIEAIMSIFTTAKDTLATPTDAAAPAYLRHMTATHQIDVIDESTARGRCYFQVLTCVGLDHWGRYVDEYCMVDGEWKFARRQVTVDGYSSASLFGSD